MHLLPDCMRVVLLAVVRAMTITPNQSSRNLTQEVLQQNLFSKNIAAMGKITSYLAEFYFDALF